jgi:outer membrane lipoprotein SlyB
MSRPLATLVFALCAGAALADPVVTPPGEPEAEGPAVAGSEIFVYAARGQTDKQLDRDRYECHNWAVAQTGETPTAAPNEEPRDSEREVRRQRVDRAIAGAAIGGIVGSIFGGGRRHDSSDRVLVGAAAGAAIGAATAGGNDSNGAAASEEPSDYLRALSACLEGRGYSVAMPKDLTASR